MLASHWCLNSVPSSLLPLRCRLGCTRWLTRSTFPRLWDWEPLWVATTNTTMTATGGTVLARPTNLLLNNFLQFLIFLPPFATFCRDCLMLCALHVCTVIFVNCLSFSFVGFVAETEGVDFNEAMNTGGFIFKCFDIKINVYVWLIYCYYSSRFGTAVCNFSKGPVVSGWIHLLDCAPLPHDPLADPEPAGTQHTSPPPRIPRI